MSPRHSLRCETGLSDPSSTSDEYIGLPSGFLKAGSSSIVSSLWSVDDFATALLMIRFTTISTLWRSPKHFVRRSAGYATLPKPNS
jgi:hypothetical protein